MSSPLITVTPGTQIQNALRIMRDRNVRKLPVVNKKGEVLGIISQQTIAEVIRNATSTPPRLISPPVKAILGNLGFVLQFSGVLILVPAVVATILNDTVTATGIYLTTVMLLVTGFFLNSYGEKSSLNMRQASILVSCSTGEESASKCLYWRLIVKDRDVQIWNCAKKRENKQAAEYKYRCLPHV